MESFNTNLSHDNESGSSLPSRMLGNKMYRSDQIFQIIKIKNKKKWTKEEDVCLIKLAEKFKEKHWKEISKNFTNKNALQCFSRYKGIRQGIVKGSWSRDEDEKIMQLVKIYGKAWSKISKVLVTRNGKQIRDRFINVLDPFIKKGKFTEEEDVALIRLYQCYGSKWATISKYFLNRTADMIKNRFHSSIKKIFFCNGGQGKKNSTLIKKYNLDNSIEDNNIHCNNTSQHTSNTTYDQGPLANPNQNFSFSIPDSKHSSPNNAENNCTIPQINTSNEYNNNLQIVSSQSSQFIEANGIFTNPEENVEYREYINSLETQNEEMENYAENDLMNLRENQDFSNNCEGFFHLEDYFSV